MDFLLGCFDKSYGTIKSQVFGNFLYLINGIPQSSGCAFGLTRKYDYKAEALHLVLAHITFLLLN